MNISTKIDHTLLKADATIEQIEQLCQEAAKYKFATVCINPHYIALGAKLLKESSTKVCTVIGFPLGANKTAVKLFEAIQAIEDGAEEVDYVLNISDVKNGEFEAVLQEMIQFVNIKKNHPKLVIKIILETCYLTNDEITKVSLLARKAGLDYVKTSTGFGTDGATQEAVRLMKKAVGDNVKVKASGGVRTATDAAAYIELGVERIGTSNGISILEGVAPTSNY
ncbi:deoxyribose-phosphate aldolase [Kurthia sibirica]|uniref:Deoxyribose-phosphate aldolase n=2 Tax=Kurthia sibirica TaxID=202750 RepID=A0A2U3APF9_9BACL|nr:deoxyribose-phosphate aldolase [Kurthia sibirica]GEK32985.1 deoxyribose-phosphate aldolase [Kurthia sibirica]